MSVYFIKGRGWWYDFTLKGIRYTEAWFKTKAEAKQAKVKRKEEIENPISETRTDITFLDMINFRLDYVKAYNSVIHYKHYCYMSRRWIRRWGKLPCSRITQQMVRSAARFRKKQGIVIYS